MTMVRGVLLGMAAALAGLTSSFAADMYPEGSKYNYAPVNDWHGFYFGASAGYAWNRGSLLNIGVANLYSQAGLDAEGAQLGLQTGYNWQTGRLVYGLELDIQGSDL